MGQARSWACALLAAMVVPTAPAAGTEAPQRIAWIPSPDRFGSHYVMVAVGGGREVPVLFDTGSVGLRIDATAVGPEVTRLGTPVHEAFEGGDVYDGQLATAKVTVGGVAATVPVSIQLIEQVSCLPAKPQCRMRGGLAASVRETGAYGTLGAGMGVKGPLMSPLAALPGNWGRAFVVSRDALWLGPTDVRAFRVQKFTQSGKLPTGEPAWSRTFRTCFTLETRPPASACADTIFDTGFGNVGLPKGMPASPPAGAPLHVVVDGAIDWRVTVGSRPSIDRVSTLAGPHASLGRPLLGAYDVLFDRAEGAIGFRRRY
ncbi:MAG: DUF3443 family protein [Burkholderiales bacterium]